MLPEARLCLLAAAHLRSLGWRVVSEVPYWERAIDLGGTRDGAVLGLEAKTGFTKRLQSQVLGVRWHTDYAIAVVSTTPRREKLAWARENQIGVWQVTASGRVVELLAAGNMEDRKDPYKLRLHERMMSMRECSEGGLPCLEGQGPAAGTNEAIAVFRKDHPEATWEEVYRNVPSHYANARSMAGCMSKLAGRRMTRERRRARRLIDAAI